MKKTKKKRKKKENGGRRNGKRKAPNRSLVGDVLPGLANQRSGNRNEISTMEARLAAVSFCNESDWKKS